MKKKKVLSLVLVAAMTAALMAGCGSDNGGSSNNGGSTNNGGGSTGSKVTVRIVRDNFNNGAIDDAQEKKVQDAINKYLADKGANFDVQITDILNNEYGDKVNLALANKEIDLLWTASWMGTVGTNDLYPKGAAMDLTDLLKGTALYNSMDAGQWEATKYDGKNYFIPVYKDNVEGYDFMFRQDLIDKHGWKISNVKKLADLEPMLADAKADGLKYPFLTQKTAMFYRWYLDSFDFFSGDVAANWIAVDRSSNSVVNTVASSQYKEFCKLMADWASKGYISEDEATKTTSEQATQSKDWAVSWWTDIPVNDEADSRYNQDVTMQQATERYAHSTSALGSCYCIPSTTTQDKAKAAIEFLGMLYTDSTLADIYTFGIEGEDFNYEGSGASKKVRQADDAKYNHSMWESASATVVTPLYNEPDNKADLYKSFNGGAKTSCAAGFRFDRSPVEAEYSACTALFEDYGFQLENGAFSPDQVDAKIDEYLKKLDAAGYQKILAEAQKQYDAWKK